MIEPAVIDANLCDVIFVALRQYASTTTDRHACRSTGTGAGGESDQMPRGDARSVTHIILLAGWPNHHQDSLAEKQKTIPGFDPSGSDPFLV